MSNSSGDKDGQVFHATESQKRNAFEWLRDLALSGAHGSWTAGVLLREIVELKAARSSYTPVWIPVSDEHKTGGRPRLVMWSGAAETALPRAAVWFSRRTFQNEEFGEGWTCYYTGVPLTDKIDRILALPEYALTEPSTVEPCVNGNDHSNGNCKPCGYLKPLAEIIPDAPSEGPTPETEAHLEHLNLPNGTKVGIPTITTDLLRKLERQRDTAVAHANGLTDLIRRMEAKEPRKYVTDGKDVWPVDAPRSAIAPVDGVKMEFTDMPSKGEFLPFEIRGGAPGPSTLYIKAGPARALTPSENAAISSTGRRSGPADRRANEPITPNTPYRRMNSGRRPGDVERRQAAISAIAPVST